MKTKYTLRLTITTSITLLLLMCLAGNLHADEVFNGEGKIVGVRTAYQNGQHSCMVTVRPPNSTALQTTSFSITTHIPEAARQTTTGTYHRLIRTSMCEALLYAMELDNVEILYDPNVSNENVASLLALEIDGYNFESNPNYPGYEPPDPTVGFVKTFTMWGPTDPINTSVDTLNRCTARIEPISGNENLRVGFHLSNSIAAHNACSALAKALASREHVSVRESTYEVQIGTAPLQMMRPSLIDRIRNMF